MSAVHAVSDATPSHQIPIRIVFGVEKIIAWTQREHTPFALVERSLVRQKIPEALGAICLCGARKNLTESIGKRVHLVRPRILRTSSIRTVSTSSSVIFRVAG
jgi:hypothetical protein